MRFLPAEREGGDEGGSDRSASVAAAEADLLEDFADQVVFCWFLRVPRSSIEEA